MKNDSLVRHADHAENLPRPIVEDGDGQVQEFKTEVPDYWERRLFAAMASYYGVEMCRKPFQRQNTVRVVGSRQVILETLWPEFCRLQSVLRTHLEAVTDQFVAEVFEVAGEDE